MKPAEIRLLAINELQNKLADARQEYMNLRFQAVTGQLADTSRLKQMRKEIARFETILRERESSGQQEGEK